MDIDRSEIEKKRHRFSIFRALRATAPDAGMVEREEGARELEIIRAAQEKASEWNIPNLSNGILVPWDEMPDPGRFDHIQERHRQRYFDAMERSADTPELRSAFLDVQRALAEVQSSGNNESLLTGRVPRYELYEEGLYARSNLLNMFHKLPGTRGSRDVIQREKGTQAVAVRKGEKEVMQEATIETEDVNTNPNQISSYALMSTDAWNVSNPALEQLQLMAVQKAQRNRTEIDALHGNGTIPHPKGLTAFASGDLSLLRAATGNNGDALTRAICFELEKALLDSNAAEPDDGSMAYVIGSGLWTKAKGVALDPGAGRFLLEGRMLNDIPVVYSNNVSKTDSKGTGTTLTYMFLGNWQKITVSTWVGLQVVVDTSQLVNNQYRIIYYMYNDVLVRQPKSFAVARQLTQT